LKELFSDVFGNYVIQKLLDYGGEEDKKTIATQVIRNTRTLLCLLHVGEEDKAEAVIKHLKGG
jgi:hypothetical protein